MSRRFAPAALVALLCLSADAQAITIGKARVVAVLGQPLEATIPVQLTGGEEIATECISADVYYGEGRQARANVRAVVDPGFTPNRTVRVYSAKQIDEPVVSIYLNVNCLNVSSTRKWVAFADPPGLNLAQASPLAAERSAPDTVSAPSTDDAASSTASGSPASARSPDPAATAPARRASRPAAEARPPRSVVRRSTAPTAAAAAQRPAPKLAQEESPIRRPRGADLRVPETLTPRLRLDLIEMEALASPSLRLAMEPPAVVAEDGGERRAAAAALWKALNATPEELLRDRDQMAALEKALATTRSDMNATRETINTLQTRVADAEASRFANPLVYALGLLSLLLVGLVVWLMQQRKRDQAVQAAWWNAGGHTQVPTTAMAGASTIEPTLDAHATSRAVTIGTSVEAAASEARLAPLTEPMDEALRPDPATEGSSIDIALVDDDAPRHISVEELIDLEQQAEFFQVLGQDEAAIDLLMGHVRSPAGTSPLPYLKLMEIYQRRGDQGAYDEIRGRFNAQFNAYAPAWEEELNQGRALEDYPHVIGRLQTLWAMPSRAMDVLQSSLLRQDAEGPTFDLPAYRELLFLYSVARDLAEEDRAGGDVDLLLPVGEDDTGAFSPSAMAPLVPGEPGAKPKKDFGDSGLIEFSPFEPPTSSRP
jgi:Tfp pilus assembly protein FimV